MIATMKENITTKRYGLCSLHIYFQYLQDNFLKKFIKMITQYFKSYNVNTPVSRLHLLTPKFTMFTLKTPPFPHFILTWPGC